MSWEFGWEASGSFFVKGDGMGDSSGMMMV